MCSKFPIGDWRPVEYVFLVSIVNQIIPFKSSYFKEIGLRAECVRDDCNSIKSIDPSLISSGHTILMTTTIKFLPAAGFGTRAGNHLSKRNVNVSNGKKFYRWPLDCGRRQDSPFTWSSSWKTNLVSISETSFRGWWIQRFRVFKLQYKKSKQHGTGPRHCWNRNPFGQIGILFICLINSMGSIDMMDQILLYVQRTSESWRTSDLCSFSNATKKFVWQHWKT